VAASHQRHTCMWDCMHPGSCTYTMALGAVMIGGRPRPDSRAPPLVLLTRRGCSYHQMLRFSATQTAIFHENLTHNCSLSSYFCIYRKNMMHMPL
jgi:hypothetical protein